MTPGMTFIRGPREPSGVRPTLSPERKTRRIVRTASGLSALFCRSMVLIPNHRATARASCPSKLVEPRTQSGAPVGHSFGIMN